MILTIPAVMQERIQAELTSLPAIHGKIMLLISFNCSTSKVIGSMKITRSIEEEVRP
jgi:hypothetical protein